jgi:hypothetical protein
MVDVSFKSKVSTGIYTLMPGLSFCRLLRALSLQDLNTSTIEWSLDFGA